MRATAHFPRTADQLRAARAFVRDTLATWGCRERIDDVVLLVSELFTNAILHGAGRVDLRMELVDARLTVEVVDDGRGPPVSLGADPGVEATTGRGLLIVDTLAARWGDGHDQHGRTRMWVEVASP
ncbi:MAG TPA: ATP-binding protein [Acidimicrobiales bacterium]|jgi:anti-sigma regulatory factor (Ser/Thr protein kinase)|nr:ATP-binding protein [Acidimicrobiales bacterium]